MPGRIVLKKRAKYHNRPVVYQGQRFDSQRELARWLELSTLAKAGIIRQLARQVRFPLVVNGVKISEYRADFTFLQAGRLVVEDAKGYPTREYKLKKKLILALYRITIKEV